MDNHQRLTLIVAVFVVSMLSAFVLPIAINVIADTHGTDVSTHYHNSTYDQNEGETLTLTRTLNTTTTNIQDPVLLDNPSVDVRVTNTSTGNSAEKRIDEGQTANITVDTDELQFTVNDVYDETSANLTAVYPHKHYNEHRSWSDGAKALYNRLDLLMVLVVLVFSIGIGYTIEL